MKKLSIFILVLSLMLISSSALAAGHMAEKGTWTFGADFDLGGNMSFTPESGSIPDEDISTGFTVDAEYLMPAKNKISYGGGIAYQLSRSLKDNEDATFSFVPLYGLLKYEMAQDSYLVGHLGYNLLSGNDNFKASEDGTAELGGGFYYAAGIGVSMENYNAELLYSFNNGSWDDSVTKLDLTYSKLSLSFGMSF
ncbi:MAG TPA: outer membrane beta-barrel protein [Halanaerobiales bacterium]|nr:outer membrane beta-barrel protein [Halanaerobiales bacterium]